MAGPPSPDASGVAWPELVSAALVGTSRASLPGAAGGDPALDLLDRAAMTVVAQRAAPQAGAVAPVPAAPAENSAQAPAAAGRRLASLLRAGRSELVGEWLELAAGAAVHAPADTLCALFEAARRDRDLRPLVPPVCGARGHWLAQWNPAWNPTRPSDLGGAVPEQLWAAEGAEGRRRLLDGVEPYLGLEHEDLLTGALADRAAGVRALALSLLARLPATAHGRTLAAYARDHVRIGDTGAVRATRPDPADADLAAAIGLRGRAQARKQGDLRYEWLDVLVAHAPLDTWIGHLGGDRAAVVRAACGTAQWDLLDALANAAIVQQNAEWAADLIPPLMERLNDRHSVHGSRGPALLKLLTPDRRADWALSGLEPPGRVALHTVARAVEHVDGPWAPPLAEYVVNVFELRRERRGGVLGRIGRAAAIRLPPDLHARLGRAVRADDTDEDAAAIRRIEQTLRLRHTMHEEFH